MALTSRSTPVAIDLRRPFTRAAALAANVSESSLRGPAFRKVLTGVYIHASVPAHPLIRVQAALLIHPPTAFASHVSAARVYDVPLPTHPLEHVSVFEKKDRRRREAIRNHVAHADSEVVTLRGIRVSAPMQMFVELAVTLDLVELVVAGDALARQGRFSPETLVAFVARSRHANAVARKAALLVREDVDSPMESRLRMLLVLAGLPEPEVNHKVYDAGGRLLYRFDLAYPDLKLIVEYDGRQHRADLDQWDHDTARRDWFDHNGWMIVPVFSRGIYRRPDQTLERVHAPLRSRGCTTLPRVLSDNWRPFFPVVG